MLRGPPETRRLPKLKSQWKKHSPSKPRSKTPDDFELARMIMSYHPTPTWYSQFGWSEDPGTLPYIWTLPGTLP